MKYYILSGYGLVSLHRSSVHETDSICPPTRCVAMAPAPNTETIRVRTMEIIQ